MSSGKQSKVHAAIQNLWRNRRKRGFTGWAGFRIDETQGKPKGILYLQPGAPKGPLRKAVLADSGEVPEFIPLENFRTDNTRRGHVQPAPVLSPGPAPSAIRPGDPISAVSPSCDNGCVGTIAAFLRQVGTTGPLFALTNNHVLARDPACLPGLKIVSNTRVLSTISPILVPLKQDEENDADVAIVQIDNGVTIEAVYPPDFHLNDSPQPTDPQPGVVTKLGSGTGITSGKFVGLSTMEVADCAGTKFHEFSNQMAIESSGQQSFSCRGDSGSLVIQNGQPVGLLFANCGNVECSACALATPFKTVLEALKNKTGKNFEIVLTQAAQDVSLQAHAS